MAHYQFLENRYTKAMKLPLGHYEREAAEKAVQDSINREYGACRLVEDAWKKKIPKDWRIVKREQVLHLIYAMCDAVHTTHVKLVHFGSNKGGFMAAACYNPKDKSIHFTGGRFGWGISITTVVHETAHHVAMIEKMGWGHGPGFIEVEELLFDATIQHIKKCREAEGYL